MSDLLDLMKQNFFDTVEIPNIDVSIEPVFLQALSEDNVEMEALLAIAPWNKLDTESEEEYAAFKAYVGLSVDVWKPEAIVAFFDIDRNDAKKLYKRLNWAARRMALLKYLEWERRREEEKKQVVNIRAFRDNQATLLRQSSMAAITLVQKLQERIAKLDSEDIKVSDIPKYVSSLSTFLTMAADAEARMTTINELLAIYEDEIQMNQIDDYKSIVKAGLTDE